ARCSTPSSRPGWRAAAARRSPGASASSAATRRNGSRACARRSGRSARPAPRDPRRRRPPVALAFDPRDDPDPAGTAALDAYSMVVTTVAERMLRSVAGLRVVRTTPRGPRPAGGGSAVVLTPDGHLLTSAHVVEGARGGVAAFPDGRELEFSVAGSDRL